MTKLAVLSMAYTGTGFLKQVFSLKKNMSKHANRNPKEFCNYLYWVLGNYEFKLVWDESYLIYIDA